MFLCDILYLQKKPKEKTINSEEKLNWFKLDSSLSAKISQTQLFCFNKISDV